MFDAIMDAVVGLAVGKVGNSMAAHREALRGRGLIARLFFQDVTSDMRPAADGGWLSQEVERG